MKKLFSFLLAYLLFIQSSLAAVGPDGRPILIRRISSVDLQAIMNELEENQEIMATMLFGISEAFDLRNHQGEEIDEIDMLKKTGNLYFKSPIIDELKERLGIIISQNIDQETLETGSFSFGIGVYSENFERQFGRRAVTIDFDDPERSNEELHMAMTELFSRGIDEYGAHLEEHEKDIVLRKMAEANVVFSLLLVAASLITSAVRFIRGKRGQPVVNGILMAGFMGVVAYVSYQAAHVFRKRAEL